MSSMQYYKPAHETCQQKCLESCYGHKPSNGGSYIAGQSTGLYGQGTYPCTDHNMAKPAMNHSSYGQTTYGQPTLPANPNMSHSTYGTQTYGHLPGHMTGTKPVGLGHNQCMDKVHSHGHNGHGHGHAGQHGLHGMASCHGKSHEKKKGDHCKKKDKSLSKKKYKNCNRSCGDSSGADSSDCDSD